MSRYHEWESHLDWWPPRGQDSWCRLNQSFIHSFCFPKLFRSGLQIWNWDCFYTDVIHMCIFCSTCRHSTVSQPPNFLCASTRRNTTFWFIFCPSQETAILPLPVNLTSPLLGAQITIATHLISVAEPWLVVTWAPSNCDVIFQLHVTAHLLFHTV